MVDTLALLALVEAEGRPRMTVPMDYLYASRDFRRFLGSVKERAMLATNNQSYAVTRAVLHVFRSHLALRDVLVFAEILPPLLRVTFLEGLGAEHKPIAFPDRQTLLEEVKAVREPHNIAPDSAIDDVAEILRAEIGEATLRRVLGRMPQDAQAYWLAS
ncbi:DUF2267 domain-containing protein [Nitratireductor indicus]|nr:DUF2267 domain-containing protein [Nitratireductor indicus]SFQ73946.1 Uncharacterized conserved protein, DUF2267 family [Nitratireductor indicus]